MIFTYTDTFGNTYSGNLIARVLAQQIPNMQNESYLITYKTRLILLLMNGNEKKYIYRKNLDNRDDFDVDAYIETIPQIYLNHVEYRYAVMESFYFETGRIEFYEKFVKVFNETYVPPTTTTTEELITSPIPTSTEPPPYTSPQP